MPAIHDWTILRDKRDLTKFDKQEHVSYRAEPTSYPCLAKAEQSSDENMETRILYPYELRDMLAALTLSAGIRFAKLNKPVMGKFSEWEAGTVVKVFSMDATYAGVERLIWKGDLQVLNQLAGVPTACLTLM